MKFLPLLSLLLGSLVIFQPAINRLVADAKGLSFAALLNASVILITASLFFLVISLMPERFPKHLRFISHGVWNWWFLLPGLIGFVLVLLTPVMIKNLGAFPTVSLMMLGQVSTSIIWDSYAEGIPFNMTRCFGVLLVLSGAYFSMRPVG
jgi:uncharacterized membrane protein YdcZ (DUF606 family)